MEIIKQIKWWVLHGIWFLLVIWLAWVWYASFTGFSWLAMSSWDILTAQKWTDLVDAVQDEYSTTETLTNKVWLNQPLYRKVIELTSPANSAGVTYNVAAQFTWGSNCRVVNHIIYRTDGWNSTSAQNSFWETDIKNDCSTIWIKHDWSSFVNSVPVKMIIEYTK